ncbi:Imm40 family immunity protein [Neisseria zalophi]|uniref:Imm40 family immunity protein n=1 Tax=Neisseria zalophi TaxID=640030 RepID=UPI00177E0DF4|nr:Imm40 family immunity protein [Neisseria zalophi]
MNNLLNIYVNYGISLYDKGESVIILPKNIALIAINYYLELGIIILGGDIYEKVDDKNFNHTYDNWYYEGNSSAESIIKARGYLQSFNNKNVYVSFVVRLCKP